MEVLRSHTTNYFPISCYRPLVADLVAEGAELTVSKTVRETVEAVQLLAPDKNDRERKGVSLAELAGELGIDKSSASRRAKQACGQDYLVNLETRPGRPACLKVGEPLPAEMKVLPSVEALQCCTDPVEGGPYPDHDYAFEPNPKEGPTLDDHVFVDQPDNPERL